MMGTKWGDANISHRVMGGGSLKIYIKHFVRKVETYLEAFSCSIMSSLFESIIEKYKYNN